MKAETLLGYGLLAVIVYLIWKHGGKSRNAVPVGTKLLKNQNAQPGSGATAGDSFKSGCAPVAGVCERTSTSGGGISCEHVNLAHFPICTLPPPFAIIKAPAPVAPVKVPIGTRSVFNPLPVRSPAPILAPRPIPRPVISLSGIPTGKGTFQQQYYASMQNESQSAFSTAESFNRWQATPGDNCSIGYSDL